MIFCNPFTHRSRGKAPPYPQHCFISISPGHTLKAPNENSINASTWKPISTRNSAGDHTLGQEINHSNIWRAMVSRTAQSASQTGKWRMNSEARGLAKTGHKRQKKIRAECNKINHHPNLCARSRRWPWFMFRVAYCVLVLGLTRTRNWLLFNINTLAHARPNQR